MDDFKVRFNPLFWVVVGKGPVTFRAGCNDLFNSRLMDGRHVQLRQFQKVCPVSGPQEVMTTTSFILKDSRIDVEEIEESEAVQQDILGLNLEIQNNFGSIELKRNDILKLHYFDVLESLNKYLDSCGHSHNAAKFEFELSDAF